MSLKSAPYYWVICDGCGANSTEASEHSAWSEPGVALEDAENWDWTFYRILPHDAVHLCPDCTPKTGDGDPWEELPHPTVKDDQP